MILYNSSAPSYSDTKHADWPRIVGEVDNAQSRRRHILALDHVSVSAIHKSLSLYTLWESTPFMRQICTLARQPLHY